MKDKYFTLGMGDYGSHYVVKVSATPIYFVRCEHGEGALHLLGPIQFRAVILTFISYTVVAFWPN